MKFSITKMLPFAALLLATTMVDNSAAQGLHGIFLNTQSNSDNIGICKTVTDQFKLGIFDPDEAHYNSLQICLIWFSQIVDIYWKCHARPILPLLSGPG